MMVCLLPLNCEKGLPEQVMIGAFRLKHGINEECEPGPAGHIVST